MFRKTLQWMALGFALSAGYGLGTLAKASELGWSLLDTGGADTGSPSTDDTGITDTGAPGDDTSAPTDDTGAPTDDTGAPTDDTGAPTDDTAAPTDDTSEPADDTGVNVDDTGEAPIPDSGLGVGKSAAELAGEKGGCSCAAQSGGAGAVFWLPLVALIAARRRYHL